MTPQEFVNKWKISRSQLSLITGYSQVSIDHWFSEKSTREPPPDVLARLDEIDSIFECWRVQDERIPHLRDIYESIA